MPYWKRDERRGAAIGSRVLLGRPMWCIGIAAIWKAQAACEGIQNMLAIIAGGSGWLDRCKLSSQGQQALLKHLVCRADVDVAQERVGGDFGGAA
jgi:hypothetical protein